MITMRPAAFAVLLILSACWQVQADTCESDEFHCYKNTESLECINQDWVCDDFGDCDGEEDETDSLCKAGSGDGGADNVLPTPPSVEEEEEVTTVGGSWGGGWWGGGDDDTDYSQEDEDYSSDGVESQDGVSTTPRPPEEIPEMCSLKTCNPGGQFAYSSGRTYRHKYSVTATTQVKGTSEKQAHFTLAGDVALDVLTACEMELKFTSAEMTSSTPSGTVVTISNHSLLNTLTENSLRFSMSNGLVDTVCPRANETRESLNMKRGLIALFQNTMTRFDLQHNARETDLLGQCDMMYKFSGTNDTSFYIDKIKDLASCTNELSVVSSVKGVPYTFIGGLQSAPVLESSSSCRQGISKKRINSVECSEQHRLTPFSSGEGGVVTDVTQSLHYLHSSFINPKRGAIYRRTGLEYEHFDVEDPPMTETEREEGSLEESSSEEVETAAEDDVYAQDRARVDTILQDIAEYLKSTRSSVARPSDFSSLVSVLRRLPSSQLMTIAGRGNRGKEWLVFLDAIPTVGTAASVDLIKSLLESRTSLDRADQWLRSLAYIPRPDHATLTAALGLLKLSPVPHQAFLGLGALVNNYCSHQAACRAHQPVQRAMAALHDFLDGSCARVTSREKIQTLMALKGVGNAGRAATENTADLLKQCIEKTSNENEIRVAAVNAFRHLQCNLTSPLEAVVRDLEEDSEVRISAYLGVMRCAGYDTLALVRDLLHNEEVNQVGSFIWTHLTNVQEGALPSHATLQGLLSNLELQDKFSSDARKFSRNFEWSAIYDPLNIAGSVEANILFSQKSYIPRSTSLNFTTDLFGQSINWLELEARVEGLERPLEEFFMGGMPPPASPRDGINDVNIRTLIERTGERASYRSKDPELSLAMRTFGSDVYYQHLHGAQPIMEALKSFDPREYVERLNKGETLSLQQSTQPVESSGRVATSAGLPLTVAVTGTLSLDVSAKATIQFGSLMPGSFDPSLDIRGTLIPSINSDLTASVTIDGMAAVAGVEVEASLTSTSSLSGRLVAKGINTFNLDISVPSDKMEVVNVTSRLILLHGAAPSTLLSSDISNREYLDSDSSSRIETDDCTLYSNEIGAKVCWSALFPDTTAKENVPSFPLSGPAHLRLLLLKTDPQLSSYQLKYNLVRQPDESSLVLSANTPGTSHDREHILVMSSRTLQRSATFRLHTPYRNFEANGMYSWDDVIRRLAITCHLEGYLAAEVDLSLKSYEKSRKSYYKPTAKIKWRGRDLFSLEGDVEVNEKVGSELYKLDLNFNVNSLDPSRPAPIGGTVKGEITSDNSKRVIDVAIDYNIAGEAHDISVEYTIENASVHSDWKFVSSCKVVFSQFRTLNFISSNSYRMKPGSAEMDMVLNFGEPYLDPDNAVHFHRSITFLHTEGHTIINNTLALRHSKRNLDVKLSGDFASDWGHVVNTGFIFQLVSDREISSRLDLKRGHTPLLDGTGTFQLKVPTWSDLQINMAVNESVRRNYEISAHGSAGPGRFVDLKGTYQSDPLQSQHKLLMAVRLPNRGTTNVNATALLTWKRAFLSVEVKPNSGHTYRGHIEHALSTDQLGASYRQLQLEVHTPNKAIKWTAEITVGTVITINNRVQVDRSQEFLMRLHLDILKEMQRGVKFTFQWDPNRDPNKKLDLTLKRDWRDSNFSSLNSTVYLGLLSHTYQMAWTTTALKLYDPMDGSLEWEQKHIGSLVWEELVSQQRQEVAATANVKLVRAETADLTATIDLTTPFEDWRENYLKLGYSRNDDLLKGSLKTRWHDHEFFDAELLAEKSYQSLGEFAASSNLDISSSFRGMASLNTGADIARRSGVAESSVYIQWEEDRVELRLAGYDRSEPGQLDYSLSSQAITSLENYRSLGGQVNLAASARSINAKAAAHWDALEYELRCRGNRYSGDDFLNGEVAVIIPGYEPDDYSGQLRIYQDPEDLKHKLLTVGKWGGKALKVDGHVTMNRRDFSAKLTVDTPFTAFPHASLVLGKGYDGVNHKSEVRLAWGADFNVGFELKAHVTSLTDFLVSASVNTPIARFREVKAEVLNLFDIGTNVRCHSRIFGQVGDERFGLGGRYEQGSKPRLRASFEVYTPLPHLELLSLDLSDNSQNHDSEYDLRALYGSNSPLHLTVVVVRGQDEEDWAVTADLPFSVLNPGLQDAELKVEAGLGWGDTRKVVLALDADTGMRRKVALNVVLPPSGVGKLEASLGGVVTVPGYEEVSLTSTFMMPDYDTLGILDASFRTRGAGTTAITIKGDSRTMDAAFTSPIEPFRTGEVRWRRVPVDVVRESVTTIIKWETGTITMEGTAHIRSGVLDRMEAQLATPWSSMEYASFTVDNNAVDGGFTTHIIVKGDDVGYVADVDLDRSATGQHGWNLKLELDHTSGSTTSHYTSDVTWRFENERIVLEAEVTTPHPDLKLISGKLNLESQGPASLCLVTWESPLGSGSLQIEAQRDTVSRSIFSQSSLTLQPPQQDPTTYRINADLENRSTRNKVDLDLSVALTSNLDNWDCIKVDGTVRQVTAEPGEVRLSLTWPKLAPVTFRATIAHQDNFAVIKPTVAIEIDGTTYTIEAEKKKEGANRLVLKGLASVLYQGQEPTKVEFSSDFWFPNNKVEGTLTLKLPLSEPWNVNTATIEYNDVNGEHRFNVRMTTGGHTTTVEGRVNNPQPGQVEGTISLASTVKWNQHPVRITFKQSLDDLMYTGDYKLEFPRHNTETDTWTTGTVEASLQHSFLPAGHKGHLSVHPAFALKEAIQLDYTFEFPSNQDMTVQVRLSYKTIAMGFKVEEVTVSLSDGEHRRRFSAEFENPLWPIGVSNFKITKPNGNKETLIEIYDMTIPNRKVTLSVSSTREDQGRMLTIETIIPAGRKLSLTVGYHFSTKKIDMLFNFSWMQDKNIDVGFKWEDISTATEKKHHLEARFTQPFRAVVVEADYQRRGTGLLADLTFNWNAHRSMEDVLKGKLQWDDQSSGADKRYQGLLTLTHPSLPQDIKTEVDLQRSPSRPLVAGMKVQYSADRAKDLTLGLNVTKMMDTISRRRLVTQLIALHPHTQLKVEGSSELVLGGGLYSYEQQLSYSNMTGHPFQTHLELALDLQQKELRALMSGHKTEVDVRLVVVDTDSGWRVQAMGGPGGSVYPVSGTVELHPLYPVVTVTVDNTAAGPTWEEDEEDYEPRLRAKKLILSGGVEDMRNAVFSLSHVQTILEDPLLDVDDISNASYIDVLVTDVDFSFRLNHTRLLTSRVLWRPLLKEELGMELGEVVGMGRAYRQNMQAFVRQALKEFGQRVLARARPILTDLGGSGTPLLAHFRNQSRAFIVDLKKVYTTFNLTAEEVQLRNSLTFIFSKFGTTLREKGVFAWIQRKLSGGTLKNKIIAIIAYIKDLYKTFRSGSGGGLREKLAAMKSAFAETHDKLAKKWYLKLSAVLSDFRTRLRGWLRSRWHAVYHNYKPHIITTIHNIDTAFNQMIQTMSGMMSNIQEGFTSSSYYKLFSEYTNKAKGFVDAIFKRPLKENLELALDWAESMIHKGVNFFLTEVAPFLEDWMAAVRVAWGLLEEYPLVQHLQRRVTDLAKAIWWGVSQINFRERLIQTVAFSVENGYTIVTQTALQAEHSQRRAKTTLFLDAEKGYLQFAQKLPMEWYAFNQKPKWEELKEWRLFKFVTNLFSGGHNINILDYWYKNYNLKFNPRTWLPPFEASSKVVGQQHLISWNGELREYRGVCRYLLAADLVSQRWAIVLNYHANAPNAYILYLDGQQIEMEQKFAVKVNGQYEQLPHVLQSAVVLRSGEQLVLRQESGLTVSWNQLHDVFSISVPGIYFGKVGGLLGTNNYEHLDDQLTPTSYLARDTKELAEAWKVSRGNCVSSRAPAVVPHQEGASSPNDERCSLLFTGPDSPFKYCFYQVSSRAYDQLCRTVSPVASAEVLKQVSCRAASAYRQACSVAGVPTKIPHDCNMCYFEKADGEMSEVPESQTTVIPLEEVPKSTDVVLIVEAGACNANRNVKRNLKKFLQAFDGALDSSGVQNSRYTAVTYGGHGFFSAPQQVMAGSALFGSPGDLGGVLASMAFYSEPANSHVDSFEALRFASNLPFRAGVTPTFIVMPCTPCLPDVGSLDFATMYHILVDRGVVLHTLTQQPLVVSKQSVASKILGMDSHSVYTTRDSTGTELTGDQTLRRQVSDPREHLEYCSPLALQTNGTIFSSRFMLQRRRRQLNKLAVVLGRRVARTAFPRHAQRCICLPTADDSVKMKCHKQRPEWGEFSMMAPYFDEEASEDYYDTLEDTGY